MKLFLTGANGLIGRAVRTDALRRGIDCFEVSRRSGPALDLAAMTRSETFDLLSAVRPDAIVHLAGASSLEECDREPEAARALHVTWPAYASEWCRRNAALFAYPSTVAVFDGLQDAPYREDDLQNPLSYYGALKAEGERLTMRNDRFLIFRSAAVFGVSDRVDGCFPEQLLRDIPRGKKFRLFTDVPFAPIDSASLAGALLDLIGAAACGTFHLAGGQVCSRWDFGRKLLELAGLDAGAITPSRLSEADLTAPRPRNQALSSEHAARAIGRAMPGMEHAIQSFLCEFQPHRETRMPDLAASRR